MPGICTLGIIASSFVNLVITITAQRESGVLKRRRSTPVPAWVLIASRVLTSAILAIVIVAVIVVIGRIAYGVHLPGATFPAFLLSVVVGAASFCCLVFCRVQLHPQRGLGAAPDPGDNAPAVFHLGHLRAQGSALEHAA